MNRFIKVFTSLFILLLVHSLYSQMTESIPLPEHPRPDFMREEWLNLNGYWDFRFDEKNIGETEKWFNNPRAFNKKILVPFPWGSKLSEISNEADIAWYARKIQIPAGWEDEKVYVVFGASDWKTTVWIDGQLLGTYQGGYTPFEFDLTPFVQYGQSHTLVVKADDTPHDFKLYGKQGYGDARGLWQTVYLEARGNTFIRTAHFTPDIDHSVLDVMIILNEPAISDITLIIKFLDKDGANPDFTRIFKKGSIESSFTVPIKNMHLWDLDDPYLYDIQLVLNDKSKEPDEVTTYFGMRKISVMNIPGLNHPYIALNNKPVYLQLTLDQSYHPDGFYTFPSDEFMRDEILRSKQIGLNGNRIHIKVELPRKLYWADKLGLLIMADVPNSWGEPGPLQQKEWETAMRGMLNRDYNHPSIFSWVLYNETWGLSTRNQQENGTRNEYLPSTQAMVAKMYRLTKQLDPSRLVEDNSANRYDHVVTDINSWHAYLPGYKWKEFLDNATEKTFEGSTWNFTGGNRQGNQPMMNSECGNVWGYQGSTGDIDWSWDYHIMMNEFRLHPKVCGWLYTEHHDVINEWNGYYKYDRSGKYTGLEELVPGMSLKDFHSDMYIATRGDLCRKAKPGETVSIPLVTSFMTDHEYSTMLYLKAELAGWDQLGQFRQHSVQTIEVPYKPWSFEEIAQLPVMMPSNPGLSVLRLTLEDAAGKALHHNFVCFVVENEKKSSTESIFINEKKTHLVSFDPAGFMSEKWSLKQWNVLDNLKVNGAGYGYFEYEISIPENIKPDQVEYVSLVLEASAKELFGKDKPDREEMDNNYMLGKGTFDNSRNPNSYPMTDDTKFPSLLKIRVNGEIIESRMLEDDPADHRGILSWFAQPRNNKLNEAGSYGYLINANIPTRLLNRNADKKLTIRFEVDESLPGGLAIYGEHFGRYPMDPTLVFVME